MERTIKIANKELRELLEKRNNLVLEGRKNDEKRQKLEEKINKGTMEIQKVDGKAGKIIEGLDIKLEKNQSVFETVSRVALENDMIVVGITDRIKEYAEALVKKDKEDQESKRLTSKAKESVKKAIKK